jgi:hypothetical protein
MGSLRHLSFRTDLASDPAECARRVVVVTVLRGAHRNLPGYAITGLFEMDEAALVECALTWCPVLKGLPTFSARIGGQPMTRKLPSATIAVNGRNVDI